jgi:hypothetical protein
MLMQKHHEIEPECKANTGFKLLNKFVGEQFATILGNE